MKQQEHYYVTVRALNENGLYSLPLHSDGFIYRPRVPSLKQETTDKLLIKNVGQTDVLIQIYDMKGRKLMEETLTDNDTTIDTRNWTAGIYLMQVWENGELLSVEKIIKP